MERTLKQLSDSEAYAPALRPHFAVADGIAVVFAPYAEVVVHDLATESIAHIANPISRRAPGDPSQLEDIEFDVSQDLVGPYVKTNWDGRRLKCISIVLTDQEKAIGLFCINVDVSQFDQIRIALDGFLGTKPRTDDVQALFVHDWHERINEFIAHWCSENDVRIADIDRPARRQLILALKESGALEQRRAPAYIARILSVSRATIYNELAAIKQEQS
tara:strand:+ start:30935 stop:31588 length:654 start_codon:yes stop_codon:yes gene_type:complete